MVFDIARHNAEYLDGRPLAGGDIVAIERSCKSFRHELRKARHLTARHREPAALFRAGQIPTPANSAIRQFGSVRASADYSAAPSGNLAAARTFLFRVHLGNHPTGVRRLVARS